MRLNTATSWRQAVYCAANLRNASGATRATRASSIMVDEVSVHLSTRLYYNKIVSGAVRPSAPHLCVGACLCKLPFVGQLLRSSLQECTTPEAW
jgi:hypothetical protein